MASIGKLVSAIAEIEGLDEGAVKLIARYAREAGYISQGSYGPGAARMTPRDAANLLIAVNATGLAKETPKALQSYSALTWRQKKWIPDQEVEADRDDPFKKLLHEGIRLDQALEELILLATPIFSRVSMLEQFFANEHMQMTIEFSRPHPRVAFSVTYYEAPEDEDGKPEYDEIEGGYFASGEQVNEIVSDRVDEVTITHRTLIAVGKSLAI